MKQITLAPRNHLLTNISIRTPDSQWLVSNVRPSEVPFTGETIERVNIHIGEVRVIYRMSQSAYVGVMTVYPKSERHVFIHGPENLDETWYYDFHHRHGVIVESGKMNNPDTVDITASHTLGALHDDSHVHIFSPNGERVSSTYSDYVMYEPDLALDSRSVSAAASFGPVNIQKQHPRECNGSHWCVLVSKITPMPQPDSDEINRAHEEGWVGNCAPASASDTLSTRGEKMPELLIVELPKDEVGWEATGDVPLSGAGTTLLVPPHGVVQRRLTFTHHWTCPELVNIPRR